MNAKIHELLSRVCNRRMLLIYGIITSVFIAGNVAMYAYYLRRPYPRTTIAGKPASLNDMTLPDSIEFIYKDQHATIPTLRLDISIDLEQTRANLLQGRAALPIANFFIRHNIPLSLKYDQATLSNALTELLANKTKEAIDAKIVIENGDFVVQDAVEGTEPNIQETARKLPDLIAVGNTKIIITERRISPKINREQLAAELESLQAQRKTSISFSYNGKSKQLSPQEITNWYVPSADKPYILGDSKIRSTISAIGSSFGIRVQNLEEAVRASKNSIQQHENMSFNLTARSSHSLTYCTNVRGVDASHLGQFNAKLASVYADRRGWSLGGDVSFTRVSSGCDFTVWLSDASQVPSFGSICDTEWSCNVGRNVIINFDRWRYASTAWNNAGGSLEDYRVMVINHETGHNLGFGHISCSGPGQLAPVMQQQSIDLQGCVFNIWPTAREISLQRASLGL